MQQPTITMSQVDALVPYARNARQHSEAQIAQIAASIREFGWTNPILTDGERGVIAGHGRLAAARKLGITQVPTIELAHLSKAQRRALVLADNKLALSASWDDSLLAAEFEELELEGYDLAFTGFAEEEVRALRNTGTQGLTDPDEVPEPPLEPITKPGDLWLLRDHRLLCGDATKAEDVERLMDGAKADLCFTSPPYALGKSAALSGNKIMSAKANPYGDHEDNAHDWDGLMRGWFAASNVAVSDAWVVNVQPLAGNKRDLVRFIADNASRLVDIVTWDKGHAAPQIAAGVMASRFEWLIVFAANNKASRVVPLSSWRGTVQSLYAGPPQRSNEFSQVHAATMPIHVPTWVLSTLCNKAASVFEPFCGTGTTLIAAEQLGRKCYGMEISAQYCDVIVKRWENFTGNKARLQNGNP